MEERYNVEAAKAAHQQTLENMRSTEGTAVNAYDAIRRAAFVIGLSLVTMFIAQNVISLAVELIAVPILNGISPSLADGIYDDTSAVYYVVYFIQYFLMFAPSLIVAAAVSRKKGLFTLFKPRPKKVSEFDSEAFAAYLSDRDKHRALRRSMLPEVLLLLPVMMGSAYVMSIVATYIESVFNIFGLVSSEIFSEEPVTLTGWVFYMLTLCVAAPVCEELLFRGAFLKILKPFGAGFAITVQALLFSLFHGTLSQLPYTLIGGLIMGYLAYRYGGILPTVILHALNNCLSVVISSAVPDHIYDTPALSAVFTVAVYSVFIAGGLFAIKILHRRDPRIFKLGGNTVADRMQGLSAYSAFFTHPANISYIILQMGTMLALMALNGINLAMTGSGI